ncbi:MAG: hypothetical protein QOD77_1624 [Thermoplasmata archaeon]|jgi:hypothetical protein|nr:hypothetical protein [Thermoplasmata archaeon]
MDGYSDGTKGRRTHQRKLASVDAMLPRFNLESRWVACPSSSRGRTPASHAGGPPCVEVGEVWNRAVGGFQSFHFAGAAGVVVGSWQVRAGAGSGRPSSRSGGRRVRGGRVRERSRKGSQATVQASASLGQDGRQGPAPAKASHVPGPRRATGRLGAFAGPAGPARPAGPMPGAAAGPGRRPPSPGAPASFPRHTTPLWLRGPQRSEDPRGPMLFLVACRRPLG